MKTYGIIMDITGEGEFIDDRKISNDIILDSVAIAGKEIVRNKFGKYSPATIVVNLCIDIGNRELKNLIELSTPIR